MKKTVEISQINIALEEFKKKYSKKIVVGNFSDVSDVFSSTNSRLISEAFKKGMKVYAVPLTNGKGMFDKWQIENGKLVRGTDNRPLIKEGNNQIVNALICSGKAKFIGSDEIFVKKQNMLEGIRKGEAKNVFVKLRLNPMTDAYALLIRKPQDIKNSVKEFNKRVNGIFKLGQKWRPGFTFTLLNNPKFFPKLVGQLIRQTHPFVAEALVRDVLRDMFKDPFLRPKLESALKKGVMGLEKTRKIKGIKIKYPKPK